ncbi:hypothetical protein VP01_975g1 [Puccinia sorghi]|uniref:Uncharacterized protein n=1 Tax=Puccinia sorghi TaxID=27349 RepID=A0A0L6U6D7_9BASI|nr:hypothetical protein VP01_975g1 [Puccinia sorghi]
MRQATGFFPNYTSQQKRPVWQRWHSAHFTGSQTLTVQTVNTIQTISSSSSGMKSGPITVNQGDLTQKSRKKSLGGYFVCKIKWSLNGSCLGSYSMMNLESEDPFWNNGLFTNQAEPWAVDTRTQDGIRHLAALNHGREEKQRLAWEVHRAMRWAIQIHQQLHSLLVDLVLDPPNGNIEQTIPLLRHPLLQSLDPLKRNMAARSILHSECIKLHNIQLLWDTPCLTVLHETASQIGDDQIQRDWSAQILYLWVSGSISLIPGDFHTVHRDERPNDSANSSQIWPAGLGEQIHQEDDVDVDGENEEFDEELYAQDIFAEEEAAMMAEVTNEIDGYAPEDIL